MTYNKIFIKTVLALALLTLSNIIMSFTLSAQIQDTISTQIDGVEKIIQLGYTNQKQSEVSGAVSTINGEKLERSPVGNLSQTLSGRFPGLFTNETYSELSEANTPFYIRGLSAARSSYPLIVVDGIAFPYQGSYMLKYYITPATVESISILKDASTQALFGNQGANGVISIKTKQGRKGPIRVNTRYDQSFQQVTTTPAFINAAQYGELRNQAAYNDGLGYNYFFNEHEIENFRSGDRNLYPNNNWYDQFMKNFALMERAEVNVYGGSENVLFFSNLSVMNQGSQFKTEQPEYNSNVNNIRINFRSNIDAKLNDYIGTYLYLNGSVRRNRLPGQVSDSRHIYSNMFIIPPSVYGPVTPQVVDPETGEVIDEGRDVTTTELVESPTYGILNRSGFYKHTITNVFSHFGLNFDLGFLTKGLKASAVVAFQTNYNNMLRTRQDYERWVRTGSLDTLNFVKKGTNENTPLEYSKGTNYSYNLTYKSTVNYNRNFGKHSINGLAYIFFQNTSREEKVLPWLLPDNRLNSGIQVSYGFNSKYFAKFDMGYSGSDRYAKEYRYLATPAVSGAWSVSKESFMDNVDWITNLKLRASYGKTGNDQDNSLSRYPYLDDITFQEGGPIGYLDYIVNEQGIGNPNIEPEVFKKQNFGIDLEVLKSLSLSLDVFKERTENMVVRGTATIPLYQGIPLGNYPPVNQGVFENKGYDLNINYNKYVNEDLSILLGGFLSYAQNTIIKNNETVKSEDYAYPTRQEGYSFGQEFGYLVDYSNGNGFFNSPDELESSNLEYEFVNPRVGDLIYQDLNNDGIINDKDKAPIGTGAIPRYYYGISGDFKYKNFDFSILFQGTGKWSTIYSGIGVWESSYDGVFGSLHRNAWTKERYENGEKISSPALSLTESANHQANDYYCYNRSYLRLKNLELGYTLPDRLTKSISAKKVRFILSGQNLFTWDKMKSDDFGPEGSYSSIPVYRVYNIGLSVDF